MYKYGTRNDNMAAKEFPLNSNRAITAEQYFMDVIINILKFLLPTLYTNVVTQWSTKH